MTKITAFSDHLASASALLLAGLPLLAIVALAH